MLGVTYVQHGSAVSSVSGSNCRTRKRGTYERIWGDWPCIFFNIYYLLKRSLQRGNFILGLASKMKKDRRVRLFTCRVGDTLVDKEGWDGEYRSWQDSEQLEGVPSTQPIGHSGPSYPRQGTVNICRPTLIFHNTQCSKAAKQTKNRTKNLFITGLNLFLLVVSVIIPNVVDVAVHFWTDIL